MSRDIVVTIPRSRLPAIEQEEADVARREAAGEGGLLFYWTINNLPRHRPRRIYFVWDGAIRAYHDVVGMEPAGKGAPARIYMKTTIHELLTPIPMRGFQGFRYLS